MSRPVVGITAQFKYHPNKRVAEINNFYPTAVAAAGGLPFLIPVADSPDEDMISSYIDCIDCLILSGGSDISPHYYDEAPHQSVTDIYRERDEMEFKLFEEARKKKVPVLGICRGMQLINVALGGNLIQDLPSLMPSAHGHNSALTVTEGYHFINLEHGFLKNIFKKDRIFVNSEHHQAIGRTAEGLQICAKSDDGVIEAVESKEEAIYAVQFHPEAMVTKNPEILKIFEFLIAKGAK